MSIKYDVYDMIEYDMYEKKTLLRRVLAHILYVETYMVLHTMERKIRNIMKGMVHTMEPTGFTA